MLTASCFLCGGALTFAQHPEKSDASQRQRRQPRAASQESGKSLWYVVRKDDTLYSIARTHETTVEELKSFNGLRTNLLQIGQKLRLSCSPSADSLCAEEETMREVPSPSIAATPPALPMVAAPMTELAAQSELPAEQGSNVTNPGTEREAADTAEQPLRYRLASAGLNLLGVRYRWNGNSARSGFDCSGLVKSLFQEFDIVLPRSSREQYKVGEKVDKDKLEVGDLVFFSSRGKTPTHVGVYLGDNLFLHAARKARKVLISNLTAAWYSRRFLGARRLLDLWQPESKPAESKTN
jgi:cell wall-associated NlpC family hydrolase